MLDERLEAVAGFVPAGCRVADIGTDHAYLAMELYRRDNGRKVIAADKNAGPCQAARKTLAEAGLGEKIQVRQGDGLAAVEPGEVDTVCIAGMGGKLIADILAAQPAVFAKLETAVLQPQNGFAILRQWLYEQDWHIEQENLAKVDGRIYQIIQAKPGKAEMPDEMGLLLGPVLCQQGHSLWQEHVTVNIEAVQKVMAGIQKGAKLDTEKLHRLEKQLKQMEALLK